MKKNLLITGSGGFVGKNLKDFFVKNQAKSPQIKKEGIPIFKVVAKKSPFDIS